MNVLKNVSDKVYSVFITHQEKVSKNRYLWEIYLFHWNKYLCKYIRAK